MTESYYPLKTCSVILTSDSFTYRTAYTTLFAIIKGHLSVIPGQTLYAGSIFCCFPGSTLLQTDSHCVLLRLEWENSFFLDEYSELTVFPDRPLSINTGSDWFSVLKDYAHLRLTNTCPAFRTQALAFSFLEKLVFPKHTRLFDYIPGNSRSEQLLKDVLDYTEKNMTDFLSLSSVAEHFSLTPQYLSGLFKKHCQTTFQTYLHALRFRKAEAYLKYTDDTVEDIFYKLHLKSSQLSAARQTRTAPNEPNSFSILSTETALTYLNEFSGIDNALPDSCRIHSVEVPDKRTSVFPVWKELINLGYAANFNNSKLYHQLDQMQKQIGFRYGRLCRIFDLVTAYPAGEKILYDFNPLFQILDILINNHMYPFLELGNKRLRIQLTLRDFLVPDIPNDSEEYFHYLLEVLPAFICASINRYGYTSLTNWKFEICFPNYESYGTIDDFPVIKYIDYFCRIKTCIQSYIPECQVGGPGFNNWGDMESLKQLLIQFQTAGIVPDFLTAYLYPLHKTETNFVLSSDPDILGKRIGQLKNITKKIFPEQEIWITEFNSNLSSRNYLNDSSYQAAFIVHNLISAVRSGIKAMGYYMMSDTPLCYVDTFDMLFGGWGLFSDSSIPKPSFHAWHLLSKLGTDQLLQTDKAFITGTTANSFQCLLYHFEQLTPDYCNRNIEKDDFLHPDLMFISQAPDSWEIRFPALTPGYYLIRYYTISPDHGNVLFQWYRLHFLTPDKGQDYTMIRKLSEIPQKTDCIRVSGENCLTIRCTLSRQEIRLITIDYFHSLNKKED